MGEVNTEKVARETLKLLIEDIDNFIEKQKRLIEDRNVMNELYDYDLGYVAGLNKVKTYITSILEK